MRILTFSAHCHHHNRAGNPDLQSKPCQQHDVVPQPSQDVANSTTAPDVQMPSAQQQCYLTEHYVAQLLTQKLHDYGFEVTPHTHADQILHVSVAHHPVKLGIQCRAQDEQGALQCQISAYGNEQQDWFSKISTQSITKQLAQAVELSLKTEPCLAQFQWQER